VPEPVGTIPAPVAPRPAEAGPPAALVKAPKAQRLPYSEAALNELRGAPSPFATPAVIAAAASPSFKPGNPEAAKPDAARAEPPKTELAKVDPKPEPAPEP